MKPALIAPSILSANLAMLGQEVEALVAGGADWIHVDVMDNHYVPNLTFGPLICEALRRYGIQAHLDVHLMVSPVDTLIERFALAGANSISIHPEATLHLDRSLALIRSLGCQAGVVLNPATPLSVLDYILDRLDFILLMTVNPGFGGQIFIESLLPKVAQVAERLKHEAPHTRLAVDGGISLNNIGHIRQAGADVFIAGTAILGVKDYGQAIQSLREALISC